MASELPRALMAALGEPLPADERLAEVLRIVGDHAGLAECHLYVREENGEPFHLYRSWAGERSGGAASPAGAAADAGLPARDLRDPGTAAVTVITTPIGRMYALPLHMGQLEQLLVVRDRRGGLSWTARRTLTQVTDLLAVVLAQLRREHRLERQVASATARVETSRRLQVSTVELDHFLRLLLDLAVNATQSEGGFIAVADDGGALGIKAVAGVDDEIRQLDLAPDTGLFDWDLIAPGAPLLVRDPAQAAQLGLRSLLAVPLQRDDTPLGVFALLTTTRPASFGQESLTLVSSFADQVALMLDSTRVFREFGDRYLMVLEGIARAVDARRPGSVPFHQLTGKLAEQFAGVMGIGRGAAADLRRAGRVHDVGLAALATSPDAYAVDVEHPTVGAGLLGTVPLSPAIVEAVECHHEWYDGWGFPAGLHGDQIPLAGRVLSLAAFAADLAVGDNLRAGWGWDRVTAEVRARAGSQFDPDVVASAVPLLESLPSSEEQVT